MKAVTWHGTHDVRVDEVPDPTIEAPTDAIVRVTSSGICGSDLHLYEVLGAFIDPGDILGHEPMGVVEEVGSEVAEIAPGDRVVVPFNVSCGHCYMCAKGLMSQCETTQVHEYDTGAALLGYTNCRFEFSNPGVRVISIDPVSGEAFLCETVGNDTAFTDVVNPIRRAAARAPRLDNRTV
jgi:threonine dehydrogenase-like Zn-dependent dehydrogenase